MANTKISALTSATTPLDGTEVLPIVQSSTTKKVANNDLRPKQIQSNATSGVMQIVGPAAAATRVMTIPDANFTAARTDAANTFTGNQTFNNLISLQSGNAAYFNNSANTASGKILCGGGGSVSLYSYGSEMIRCNEDAQINFFISSGTQQYYMTTALFAPVSDNARTLGAAGNRWSTVYAGTGTINTSDATTKQQIEDLSDAERATAQAIKKLIKKFKFNDAVESKGDKARIHIGVLAQDVQKAFADNGLDAAQYALFCSDTWWERIEQEEQKYWDADAVPNPETGEEPPPKTRVVDIRRVYQQPVEGGVKKTLLGIRYEELLAFVLAAL